MDMLQFVRRVESNGIYVIQQNWYQDYRDTAMFLSMTTSGGTYNVSGFSASYPVQGWLRKPQHTLNDIRYVDDNSSAFTRYGPTQNWYEVTFNSTSTSSPIGIGREHMWYTYSNGNTVSNYAIWQPTLYPLPQDGRYEVFAFIPAVNATTENAKYEIYYYGGSTIRTVNQNIYSGVWVSLGTYPFCAGSSGYVKLTNATGEAVGAKRIGFDEIAWVYRGPLAGVEEIATLPLY